MSAPANLDWLFLTIGYTLAAAGVALLLWSLFYDRARGRRRCPKCWYDMAGVPTLTCPECGRTSSSETRLRTTRRHIRIAAVASLLFLAGIAGERLPRFRDGGWVNALPGWALVLLAPDTEPRIFTYGSTAMPARLASNLYSRTAGLKPPAIPAAARLYGAAWDRIAKAELWDWEARLYLGRCFRNDPALQPSAVFNLPDRWPDVRTVPVVVRAFVPPPLRLELSLDGVSWCDTSLNYSPHLELNWRTANSPNLHYRLSRAQTVLFESAVSTRLEVRAGPDDFLPATDSPDISVHLASVLRPRVVLIDGLPAVEYRADPRIESPPGAAPQLVFFSAELRAGDRVIARTQCDTRTHPNDSLRRAYLVTPDGAPIAAGSPLATADALTVPGATLIIRGDHRAASHYYAADWTSHPPTMCWTGEFAAPITQVESESTIRPTPN